MSSPSLATFKALFAKSHNRCAFPGCSSPLVEDSGTITGEVCHIRALRARGPRYDKDQTPEQRNAAANLVLMCGRHHKVIDTETRKYTTAVLVKIKRDHEEQGIVEITPKVAQIAQALLENYMQIQVTANSGNVAIQSPGAIQAKSLTIKTTRTKLSVEPPIGSIGASQPKVAYCQYLIDRYQTYQKADKTGKSDYKYAAIHNALKRTFSTHWKLLDEARFDDVIAYLQRRIDSTIVGKQNRAKGYPNYRSFDAWQLGD